MGFVKDMARVGTFGLAGLALSNKKKKRPVEPTSSMISNRPIERPISMIGQSRGGY